VLTTSQKGAIAEARITAAAIEAGIVVWRPVVEGCRYDLILDTGDRLLRTQCEWANRKGDVVLVAIRTCRHTPRGYVRGTYSAREIDGVAAWCRHTNECYSFRSSKSTVRGTSACGWRPRETTRNS